LECNVKLTCELGFLRGDGARLFVRLDSLRQEKSGEAPVVRIALTDVTDFSLYAQTIGALSTELRGLLAKNDKVREEERKRIAREVHDELGQILTSLRLNVFSLCNKFGHDSPSLNQHLKYTLELVDKSQETARNVARALRANVLDMGVVTGIEWVVGQFARNTGIHCETHIREEERNIHLDESSSSSLYRITQESLTNIARHANASKVDITIRQEGGNFLLKIRDNGIGFDSAIPKGGSFGLIGIRERVYMLGGELLINSIPGSGTTIEVRVPVNRI